MASESAVPSQIDVGYKWKGWDPQAALEQIEKTKDRETKKLLIEKLKSDIVERSREVMAIAGSALQRFPELDFENNGSETRAHADISKGLTSVMNTLERYQANAEAFLSMKFDPQAIAKELIGDDWPDWLNNETPEFSRYGFALEIRLSRAAMEACGMGRGQYSGVKNITVGWRKVSVPVFIRRVEGDESYRERQIYSGSDTSAHELQHAFFNIVHEVLFRRPRGQKFDDFRSEIDKVLKQTMRSRTSSENKHTIIRKTITSHYSREVGDEILANVAGGRFDKHSTDDIKRHIAPGYVDVFSHNAILMYMKYLDEYKEEYLDLDEFRKAEKTSLSGLFERGIDAVSQLKHQGYSNLEITGLLTVVPVRMWPSLARRLKEAEE